MIRIICLGKLKETYLINLVDDYKKRIEKYHKIEIVELKDENDLAKEKEGILKNIKKDDYVVLLDLKGKQMTSEEFAKEIDKSFMNAGIIDFVIGSSDGVDDEVKKRANQTICFSNMTFPHGLFRGILLEQIYRAFKINNNETYHK